MLARLKAAYALIMCYWFVMYYHSLTHHHHHHAHFHPLSPSPSPPPLVPFLDLLFSGSTCLCACVFTYSFIRLLSKWLFGLCSAVVFSTSSAKTHLSFKISPFQWICLREGTHTHIYTHKQVHYKMIKFHLPSNNTLYMYTIIYTYVPLIQSIHFHFI